MTGQRILLFSYGSGLASSMYSIICQKVHDTRFTLAQIQASIRSARDALDNQRLEITPDLMDKLLSEREKKEHQGRSNCMFERKKTNSFVRSSIFSQSTN